MTVSAGFEGVEASYAAARTAFGRLVVARTRGEDVAALERDYAARRVEVGRRLAEHRPGAGEAEMVAAVRGALGWFDELEPVEGVEVAGEEPAEARDVAALRRHTMRAFGEAGDAIAVGGETLHRLHAFDRLATEPDPLRRRQVFEAMAPLWRAVDGDGGPSSPYRVLLRSSAARWDREGSPVERNAAALGIEPSTVEPMLRELLRSWRRVIGPDRLEPWDYRYLLGGMDRRLGPAVPRDRLLEVNDAHLASLGADPRALGIRYDVFPRDGRPVVPFAFALAETVPSVAIDGSWRPTVPWVFATYATGGLGSLNELLHESGHAVHYAAIRERPALFEPRVEDGGFVEGIGELVGWDADEPAFQRRHLGEAASLHESRLGRYGGVMLDACWTLFEIELHRHPDRVPNEVWSEVTEAGLGLVPHPEWSWWAVRAQLIEAPGYLANYVFAALVAAALRARIRALRGDWLEAGGDPGWYPFVSERLLRFGAARPARRVLTEFLGGPLTATPMLEDLALAARR
jgi:hypothetical protein